MKTIYPSAGLILLTLSLAACNPAPQSEVAATDPETRTVVVERERAPARAPTPAPAPVAAVCDTCGTITRVEEMKEQGKGSGVGAVLGAIAGGVAGHQFGKGRGKDVATAGGVVGGGFAGNEIEQRMKSTVYYHVTVAMDAGGTRTVDVGSMEGLGTGSKVKVIGNDLQYAGT